MTSGRGRLSAIDMLPEEAEADIVWAARELAARKRTQADILFELNDRLAVIGCGPISKSAFNRRAVRLAAAQRRMADARAMFEGISEEFSPQNVDENTIILGEFIKTLIIELVDDGAGDKTPKEAMELARAFHHTVQAQKVSADRRRQLEADAKARLEKAVEQVTEEVGKAGHAIDAATVLSKIREAYGLEGS